MTAEGALQHKRVLRARRKGLRDASRGVKESDTGENVDSDDHDEEKVDGKGKTGRRGALDRYNGASTWSVNFATTLCRNPIIRGFRKI
ncbi:hypothetical protein PM082_010525 [Marasmius tenuissimus]|nr:hypothetical protein PM082_010525 [Marasmius tenuissimus]